MTPTPAVKRFRFTSARSEADVLTPLSSSRTVGSVRAPLPIFGFCVAACVNFVVLTAFAMLLYHGGSRVNREALHYSFTQNFFSDLGRLETFNGQPNVIASRLFTIALTLAGLALATFFLGFARFFGRTPVWKGVSWLGTIFGILAGTCFVGVAWARSDMGNGLHGWFVFNAFKLYLLAVSIYSIVIWFDGRYPRRMAWVFVFFAGLLAAYIGLILGGPSSRTPTGLTIQVVGQKMIVYASILCMGTQAAAAHYFARRAGALTVE